MFKLTSTDFPIRIVEKTDCFYLFNTKTFETISLNETSLKIFQLIRDKRKCTDDELRKYACTNGVDKNDLENLLNFLKSNQFISTIEEL